MSASAPSECHRDISLFSGFKSEMILRRLKAKENSQNRRRGWKMLSCNKKWKIPNAFTSLSSKLSNTGCNNCQMETEVKTGVKQWFSSVTVRQPFCRVLLIPSQPRWTVSVRTQLPWTWEKYSGDNWFYAFNLGALCWFLCFALAWDAHCQHLSCAKETIERRRLKTYCVLIIQNNSMLMNLKL